MIKLLKICSLFFLISHSLLSECAAEYNLATKQQEYLFITTAQEVNLGRSLARNVEKHYKVKKDAKLQQRIAQIGQKLALVSERKDITYCFTVLENERVNAFALPGGYVYVNTGLIEHTASDDEVAACLGHEIGHIAARHSVRRLQTTLGYNLLSILALAATKDVSSKKNMDFAFTQIMLGYSREDEILADQLAVKYMQKSGYDPKAEVIFLEKLKEIEKQAPLKPLRPSYAQTHPYLSERISAVKLQIYGKMDFNDYINKGDINGN